MLRCAEYARVPACTDYMCNGISLIAETKPTNTLLAPVGRHPPSAAADDTPTSSRGVPLAEVNYTGTTPVRMTMHMLLTCFRVAKHHCLCTTSSIACGHKAHICAVDKASLPNLLLHMSRQA